MKELTDTIKVFIKGEDFIGTDYVSNTDCALARALKRDGYPIGQGDNEVGGSQVWFKEASYSINDYEKVLNGYSGSYPNGVEVILTKI